MRPTIIIACRVMRELLETMLAKDMPRVYMDILLHNTPKKLAAALQAEIDAVAESSNIIIGYGLCGNGLVGVNARSHTPVSYTHLRAHETVLDLVCRLLLE